MAEAREFEVDDIERLLSAILPGDQPDPFGRLEELLVKAAELFEIEATATASFRVETSEELADIKARTFGILILVAFRALRFFFGLLPL